MKPEKVEKPEPREELPFNATVSPDPVDNFGAVEPPVEPTVMDNMAEDLTPSDPFVDMPNLEPQVPKAEVVHPVVDLTNKPMPAVPTNKPMPAVPQVDLTNLPTVEQDRIEVSQFNVLGDAEDDYSSDDSVQQIRRSSRAVPKVSYLPTVDHQQLWDLKFEILGNILQFVPQSLKEDIAEEMDEFGPDDYYIPQAAFVNLGAVGDNFLWPAEMDGHAGMREEERRDQFEKMSRVKELLDPDDSIYKMFAVALLFKHTIRVTCQMLDSSLPDWVWTSGNPPLLTDSRTVTIREQCDRAALEVQAWFSEDWPRNFMARPVIFPFRVVSDMGIMANTHLESVQKGAAYLDRKVREYKDNYDAPPEPESDLGSEDEKVAQLPDETGDLRTLRNSLIQAVRDEMRAVPPSRPPPIEVRVVQEAEGTGGAIRWAFGLALSLWVVYNMD